MASTPREAGNAAEEAALAYMQTQGFELVARQYQTRWGEIDLVVSQGLLVVMVEVRYRRSVRFGGAEGSVTPSKQKRISRTAQEWLAEHDVNGQYDIRFDVVTVAPSDHDGDERYALNWYPAAFLHAFDE